MNMPKGITVVITSCNRFDLLEATLQSFFKFNTYPVEKVLIIEDSGDGKGLESVLRKFSYDKFETIVNPEQLGQQKSIDKAYSQVKTEYIFHCEDDWDFLRKGFIEDSLVLMEAFPKLITVWGRSAEEYPADFFSPTVAEFEGIRYRKVQKDIFTLNPSLKRVSDYRLMGSFEQYTPGQFEREISDFYADLGYTAFILEEPYTNHLGWHRRIHFRDKANKYLKLDNRFKQAKASVYKMLKMGKFKK
ncbi:family 2 glycosyl transferase [Pontibacter sp. BAB1700]|nr:family 2 glycosyl transferase [Pontibacter sp. BAB1700]